MKFSPQLIDALDSLTEALADPSVDLNDLLANLATAAEESVHSLISIALTVVVEDYPFTLTVATRHSITPARASVRIPLPIEPGAAATESGFVLQATIPGAFVDLAADMSFILGSESAAIELDAHLQTATTTSSGDSEVKDIADVLNIRSSTDQALGVLLEQGASIPEADLELHRRANRAGCTEAEVADTILAGARGPAHRKDT